MMNFTGPSRPSDGLLAASAPLSMWNIAKKQAERSPMIKFCAGCAIFDPSSLHLLSKGCSHPDIKFSKMCTSVHAEQHALNNARKADVSGAWAVVFTLNGRGGCAWSSRPCYSCAIALYNYEVERVIYPERKPDHTWTVLSEHPEELIERASLPTGDYAREQRIPSKQAF